MAMSVTEMGKFFQQQADLFVSGAGSSIRAGRVEAAADAFGTAFHSGLMVALLRWRQDGSVPRQELSRALDIAAQAATATSELRGPSKVWEVFDVGPALFVERLVGEVRGIARFGIPKAAWPTRMSENPQQALDAAVLAYSDEHATSAEAEGLLSNLRGKKRLALLSATYSNYLDLVEVVKGADPLQLAEASSKAERLYLQRGNDRYFSGGRQTEGGGADNSLVVDYRAAALLVSRKRGGS